MSLWQRVRAWEGRIRNHFNVDLSTPESRRRARIYNLWFDHAILRGIWTNFHQIAPGVYRSNHPTHARFEQMKAMGIKTVVNLRGESRSAHYWTEEASCRDLGLTLVNAQLHARSAPSREELLHVIDLFPTIEPPFVMHCKSGADRAGFASAVYLLTMLDRPVTEAKKMLAPKYFHMPFGPVAILDYILDVYAARVARGPIPFRQWVEQEYDGPAIGTAYRNKVPAAKALGQPKIGPRDA
ncbi:phosphatase domain-containing putative toxin [Chachezhania sediminis]|uniref:phosphatase domain-containing putative toxin n=1 Tax=Chachezhania sediminis TaxID=2599291 RepID=UPI00131AF135|nr:tyrosine-protein phosphatase [Chachezhania sediminis]